MKKRGRPPLDSKLSRSVMVRLSEEDWAWLLRQEGTPSGTVRGLVAAAREGASPAPFTVVPVRAGGHCAFCARRRENVLVLVKAESGEAVCDHCIRLCAGILREAERK